MIEKIENIINAINNIDINLKNYDYIIIQKELEIQSMFYGATDEEKEILFNFFNEKNIIYHDKCGEKKDNSKSIFSKATIFFIENSTYIQRVFININSSEIQIDLNVKTYEDIMYISKKIVCRFDKLIKEKKICISIGNLDSPDIMENLIEKFSQQNETNIIEKIFDNKYQINIDCALDKDGVQNIAFCSIKIIPL